MNNKVYLNDGWKFTETYTDQLLTTDGLDGLPEVRIPHTVKELPFHYFDESEYQMLAGYAKVLAVPGEWEGKDLLLTFEGVAHDCKVYINGKEVANHHCGYTAFTVNIADMVAYGEDNLITVQVDSRENLNIPPFGFVIDYMTYGGIYRDVYLEVKAKAHIKDVFAYAKLSDEALSGKKKTANGYTADAILRTRMTFTEDVRKLASANVKCQLCYNGVFDFKGEKPEDMELFESAVTDIEADQTMTISAKKNMLLWDTRKPNLYKIIVTIEQAGEVIDTKEIQIGIKKAEFKAEGFYLNGNKTKIRGLNRHQSYAYVGYAMPESMQRLDATLLKKELGCNAVRTSHYPQSHYFVDECDKIGLMVFTELPGWQHIGDDAWKAQACENVRDMVTEYRNHASIILWGVRINESPDDDAFYQKTNEIAHALDESRQTGGVRCFPKSHLYEDVYTYNDFIHDGEAPGCNKKKNVTPDMSKGYLISEYGGHMYPTKSFDWEEHRAEHLLRHTRVLDAVAGEKDIAGSFGWCMFDYNTHKDFGSGDRICYHGVMDMFRNPKLAAAIYSVQQEEEPVLALTSSMDIGEHPACIRGEVYILSNADSVKMYKNGRFIKEYTQQDSSFTHVSHGPIAIDDYIGDAIAEGEDFSAKQSELVKKILNQAAIKGFKMTPHLTAMAAKATALYKMNMDDAVSLYNKYIGDWGGESTIFKFEAIKDGKVVKTITKCPAKERILKTQVSHTKLADANSYDVAAVRIQMCDENENQLSFYNEPLMLSCEGPIEFIGPSVISMKGGMTGFYVKTIKESGKASVTIKTTSGEETSISFDVERME